MEYKQRLQDFIKTQQYAVVSTVTPDGQPHSALVAFTDTPNSKIIFGTNKNTRKASNIDNNPLMSLVIGFDNPISVQLEGRAKIAQGPEAKERERTHLEKHPAAIVHAKNPEEVYVVFTPLRGRYTDISNDEESFEVTF